MTMHKNIRRGRTDFQLNDTIWGSQENNLGQISEHHNKVRTDANYSGVYILMPNSSRRGDAFYKIIEMEHQKSNRNGIFECQAYK